MAFEFQCTSCGETHRGMPALAADAPGSYCAAPEAERAKRCRLDNDDCIIDEKWYFVRGLIEVPVIGVEEAFAWNVWVSLSEASYRQWAACFHDAVRSHIGPFFGWLNVSLKPYPETLSLKTRLHLRDGLMRPLIELEPTDHPLAVEQREGISAQRVAELYAIVVHGARG